MDVYEKLVNDLHDCFLKNAVEALKRGRELSKKRVDAEVLVCEIKARHARFMADVCSEYAVNREERLMVALHDAIQRPQGVVPDSALEFYDPDRCR